MEKIQRTSKGRHPKGKNWEYVSVIGENDCTWKVYKKTDDVTWHTYKIALAGKLKGQANFRVRVNAETKYLVKSKDHFAFKQQWPGAFDQFQTLIGELA